MAATEEAAASVGVDAQYGIHVPQFSGFRFRDQTLSNDIGEGIARSRVGLGLLTDPQMYASSRFAIPPPLPWSIWPSILIRICIVERSSRYV